MLHKQDINGIKWIDGVRLAEKDIIKVLEKHNIHELDLKACLEWNQRARVDVYDNYIFIVFHFPKYNSVGKVYESNEFNIFLSEKFLITFRDFPFSKINHIFKKYSEIKTSPDTDELKITTPYIVYELIQSMVEKSFDMLKAIRLDIKELEAKVFEGGSGSLVKDIMTKKRSIVLLRHIFKPQIMVSRQLQSIMGKLYSDEIKAYFEEWEDKLNQIMSEVDILWERIDSVEDALKSMVDIKTNFTVKVLTIFSAFFLPLTLITSFYGMNVVFPSTDLNLIYSLLWLSVVFMLIIYLFLRRNGKF